MKRSKFEMVEGLAAAIWPIAGQGSWEEVQASAQNGNPDAVAAMNVCHTIAEATYASIVKMYRSGGIVPVGH